MKIRPVEAELWTDGQTDRQDEANSRYLQLSKRA
jgi:hypothetical protein